MRGIVGHINAGYTILEAHFYNAQNGYCIGRSKHHYVTWWFSQADMTKPANFYHGHYFLIDQRNPMQAAAQAAADYHHRLAESYEFIAENCTAQEVDE